MKKIIATALFAMVCLVSNAKRVDITVYTSCGDVLKIEEIGDTVTAEQIEKEVERLDWVYCGD